MSMLTLLVLARPGSFRLISKLLVVPGALLVASMTSSRAWLLFARVMPVSVCLKACLVLSRAAFALLKLCDN